MPMLSRASLLAFVAILVGPAALRGQPEAEALRVLVPNSNSAVPLLALAEEDPIAGTDLRAELFLNHPQALAALLRGDVELMLTGTSQGWENYLGGGPLVMVGTGVWGVAYLIGPPGAPPVTQPAQLRGKRLALPFPGSPLDFQTRFLLARAGLDPDRDLRLMYAAPPQAAALVLQGQVEAAALPEPLASQLVQSKSLSRLLDYKAAWAAAAGGDPRSPQVSLFCTRAFAAAQPALLTRVLEAWRAVSERISADPSRAADRFATTLAIEPAVLRQALDNTLFYVPSAEENRLRVLAYYDAVRDYLPGPRAPLGRDFFFPLP